MIVFLDKWLQGMTLPLIDEQCGSNVEADAVVCDNSETIEARLQYHLASPFYIEIVIVNRG